MNPGYQVQVSGVGRSSQTVQLDEEGDRDAVFAAFGACSPFGHSLWNGRRFLGYFEAGATRAPDESPVWSEMRRAIGRGVGH